MPPGHQPIQGSEKEPLPGATKVGPVPAEQEVRVSIILRRRGGAELPAVEPSGQALSRREFAERFGADPTDLERIEQFAAEHGLEVRESDAARRTVVVAGPAEAVARAFAVELDEYEHEGVRYRGRSGAVHVPAEIAPIVTAVIGLDSRPQAKPHFRRLEAEGIAAARATRGFTPREIAGLYDFPSDLDGSGQKIALIELGGGFRPEDLDAYFEAIGVPTPVVTAVSVAGQPNFPSTADSDDGEVVLDIEVAGAVAPGAEILVYFARNTDRGFHDAITTAVHDPREPTIVSISWGAPEDASWTEQSRLSYDEAFQEAAAMGVTVFVAAGDNGSSDGVDDGRAHVDFPASSPHVVACGGTRIESSNGTISEERVWETNGATGGGISGAFDLPSWQQDAQVDPSVNPPHGTGRGVPDVAGDADPATGYRVRVDGEDMVIGGTSAVAPLWAGLIALGNQKVGRPLGYLNPILYGSDAVRETFHDIADGSNGDYAARAGWDACTGLGTPTGKELLNALMS